VLRSSAFKLANRANQNVHGLMRLFGVPEHFTVGALGLVYEAIDFLRIMWLAQKIIRAPFHLFEKRQAIAKEVMDLVADFVLTAYGRDHYVPRILFR
jgi:hypothetical protein